MQQSKTNFEIRLMRIIAIWLGFFVSPLFAQQITMNGLLGGRSAYSHYRAVGENAAGIYLMNYRDADMRKSFTLIRVSHSLEYLQEKPIELGKRSRLIKIFSLDSGICLLYLEKTRQQIRIQYLLINPTFDQEFTGTLGYLPNAESMEAVTAEYSFNRQWCAVWAEQVSDQGLQSVGVTLFHLPSRKIVRRECMIPFSAKMVQIEEASVANEGQHACIVSFDDEAGRRSTLRFFAAFADTIGFKPLFPLNAGSLQISGAELIRDEFAGRFIFSGFYDEGKEEKTGGPLVVHLYDTMAEGESRYILKTGYSAAMVSELIGASAQEKGRLPEGLFVRKIIARDDGGTLLIAEKFYITQQLETFYINGIPQTSSKNVYHYDDVLVLSLSPSAETEWFKVIRKRQSGFIGGGYYNGIASYVCDSTVQIMYNDNATQNNRVMHLTIHQNGAILQKVLFNSDEVYTGLVPQEGRQIGYNRFVVPLTMDRQTLLLKLTKE